MPTAVRCVRAVQVQGQLGKAVRLDEGMRCAPATASAIRHLCIWDTVQRRLVRRRISAPDICRTHTVISSSGRVGFSFLEVILLMANICKNKKIYWPT
jgi:hypothetical protein